MNINTTISVVYCFKCNDKVHRSSCTKGLIPDLPSAYVCMDCEQTVLPRNEEQKQKSNIVTGDAGVRNSSHSGRRLATSGSSSNEMRSLFRSRNEETKGKIPKKRLVTSSSTIAEERRSIEKSAAVISCKIRILSYESSQEDHSNTAVSLEAENLYGVENVIYGVTLHSIDGKQNVIT